MLSGKNILIISSKSAQYGGVEKHVLDLVKGFSASNKVYVMCPEGPLTVDYEEAGAQVIKKVPKNAYDLSFSLFVKDFCKENHIHIAHAHELISSLGLFGAFLAKVPVRVYHVHTPFLLWKHPNFLIKILKSIPNWFVNFFTANFFSTRVIALTPEIKKHRQLFELVLGSKIVVVPNAIDIEYFSKKIPLKDLQDFKEKKGIPKDKIIIGNLSRTSLEKGQDLLLKAFNMLNKEYPNKYFLVIAGGGELEKEFKAFAKNNFEDSFFISGRFKDSEKLFYYNIFDFFVFPSRAEGFGYVLTEAMASKIPTLSSDLPVLKRVGGRGVLYFKAGDAKSLYDNLKKLLSLSKKDLKYQVDLAYKSLDRFSFDSFIKNYSAVYSHKLL